MYGEYRHCYVAQRFIVNIQSVIWLFFTASYD
jgi:hypothetical protein